MTVIDQKTEEPVWTLFQEGIRPMAFETNPDGSTKRIFVQLSDYHGFAAVDFAQRKEVARIELPNDVPPEKVDKGLATENTDTVVAIDVIARKEITRIKVGKSPKRNITWVSRATS